MSGLIWVQTVCKGYQQKTLVGKELIEQIGLKSLYMLHSTFLTIEALISERKEELITCN